MTLSQQLSPTADGLFHESAHVIWGEQPGMLTEHGSTLNETALQYSASLRGSSRTNQLSNTTVMQVAQAILDASRTPTKQARPLTKRELASAALASAAAGKGTPPVSIESLDNALALFDAMLPNVGPEEAHGDPLHEAMARVTTLREQRDYARSRLMLLLKGTLTAVATLHPETRAGIEAICLCDQVVEFFGVDADAAVPPAIETLIKVAKNAAPAAPALAAGVPPCERCGGSNAATAHTRETCFATFFAPEAGRGKNVPITEPMTVAAQRKKQEWMEGRRGGKSLKFAPKDEYFGEERERRNDERGGGARDRSRDADRYGGRYDERRERGDRERERGGDRGRSGSTTSRERRG